LGHKNEQLKSIDIKIHELDTRGKFLCDGLQGDVQRLKEECKRKFDHHASLEKDKINLEETIRKVTTDCRLIEGDILALKNKLDSSVSDLSSRIRRFEESNYNLYQNRDSLEKNLQDKSNEYRNLSFALKEAKEEANKKELSQTENLNLLETDRR